MTPSKAREQIEKTFINHKWLKEVILKKEDSLIEWYKKFD